MKIDGLEKIERLIHEHGNLTHDFAVIQRSPENLEERVRIIERLISIKDEIREAIMDYRSQGIIEYINQR